MPAIAAGPEIERLIQLLARLPGLGPRSARRAALFLIKKREAVMAPLASALQAAMEKIEVCKICGNIDTQNPCTVCTDARRDASVLDEQIHWLEDYRTARAKDPSPEAIKQVMTAKYPGYANDFIFAFSEKVRK